jgi:hypothetical protein
MTGDGTMELLHKIYIQYLFFGPMFVIVLAAAKSISKQKLTINYIFSLSYLFMGLAMLQILSYSTKCFPGYAYVSYFMIPVSLTSPVLLYLRFRFLIQNRRVRWPAPLTAALVVIVFFLLAGAIPQAGLRSRGKYRASPAPRSVVPHAAALLQGGPRPEFHRQADTCRGPRLAPHERRYLWREKGRLR